MSETELETLGNMSDKVQTILGDFISVLKGFPWSNGWAVCLQRIAANDFPIY